MADQQHVALLKQGVDVWNRWKQEHQQIQPDFTGAHLIYSRRRSLSMSLDLQVQAHG